MALNDSEPELREPFKESVGPSTSWEVIQLE